MSAVLPHQFKKFIRFLFAQFVVVIVGSVRLVVAVVATHPFPHQHLADLLRREAYCSRCAVDGGEGELSVFSELCAPCACLRRSAFPGCSPSGAPISPVHRMMRALGIKGPNGGSLA